MPPPPDLSSYILPTDQSSHIFTTQILPLDILPHAPSPTPSRPLAILTVGQTGAGKSHLTPALLAALSAAGRPSPAHLVADVYKAHHPAYASLPPALASPATGPDARRWLAMAVAAAADPERRLDILLESACRHPDDFIELAALLRDAGYALVVVVLAVPAALSRLGILARYHTASPEEVSASSRLPPRLTPAKVHDDSYAGLLDAARWLDESGAADRVLIVRRGNFAAYVQEEKKNPWTDGESSPREGGVAEAILRERQRPLTDQEREIATRDLEALTAVPGAAEQVAQVKALLEPLLTPGAQAEDSVALPELKPLQFGEGTTDNTQSDDVLRFRLVPS